MSDPVAASSSQQKKASTGWTKFQAVMLIITGAYCCLFIIFIPLGIPYIFAGMRLWKGAGLADQYRTSGDQARAADALEEYLHSFRIQGIIAIVGVALSIVITIVASIVMVIIGAVA